MSGSIFSTNLDSYGDNARNRRFFPQASRAKFFVLLLLPVLVAATGCEEKRVQVFPVSGKVTYLGKPAAGAMVVLSPVNAKTKDTDGIAPSGVVKDDGTFTLTVYEPGDGAPVGDYVATIRWSKMMTGDGGSGGGPNVLPKKYASAATSPIKVSVKDGPTEIPPIAIAKN